MQGLPLPQPSRNISLLVVPLHGVIPMGSALGGRPMASPCSGTSDGSLSAPILGQLVPEATSDLDQQLLMLIPAGAAGMGMGPGTSVALALGTSSAQLVGSCGTCFHSSPLQPVGARSFFHPPGPSSFPDPPEALRGRNHKAGFQDPPRSPQSFPNPIAALALHRILACLCPH